MQKMRKHGRRHGSLPFVDIRSLKSSQMFSSVALLVGRRECVVITRRLLREAGPGAHRGAGKNQDPADARQGPHPRPRPEPHPSCVFSGNNRAAAPVTLPIQEVLQTLQDLIAYFQPPEEEMQHEDKQNKLRSLKNRQNLFKEEVSRKS